MGQKFTPKGPKRYAHQRRGLVKMIETKGVFALLFDPGTGKTMTTLDYMSILALKAPADEAGIRELRVLVTAPLAAVDTWVDQAEKYVTDDVTLWAEALGGSIRQRAEALAARGGNGFKNTAESIMFRKKIKKAHPTWTPRQVLEESEKRIARRHGPRGIHYERSVMLRSRGDLDNSWVADGPDSLGTARPRLVIIAVNLDTFSSRLPTKPESTRTLADIMLDAVARFKPDLVVVDESHKIKSATSNVSRMLARIGRIAPRRGILTGTVMPAGPLDVFGQWRFLDPYVFGDVDAEGTKKTANFDGFRRRFAEMGGYLGKQVMGYKNLDEMQKLMAINAEVARKQDALDLPPTTTAVIRVDLNATETKAYAEMKKGLATTLMTGLASTSLNRLSQMMRLRQITSGHVPDDLGNMNVLGDSKVRVIDSLVNETLAGEKRIVVFALFLYEIEMLRKKLARTGTELMVITGETDKQERLRLRHRFGSDAPERIVMIAQVRTMSLSVNELVTANHAIFGSLPQDRSDFIQAQDRLNRIGQTRPVTFWFALAPGTIDEVIYQAHQTRTSLEAAVLRHIFDADPNEDDLAATEARRVEAEQEEQVGRLITTTTTDVEGNDATTTERAYGARREELEETT